MVVAVVFVVVLAKVPLAPFVGAAKLTVTFGTGFPPQSATVAPRFVANAVFTIVVCGVPADGETVLGAPTVIVSAKVAGVATPLTDPETLKLPKMQLAVNVDAVAIPEEFVVAVVLAPPPAKVPLAPEPGALNVTVTPGTGLLAASFTMAARFVPKATPACVVCGVPAFGWTDAGTWVTVTESGVEFAELKAPAPDAVAVFETVVGDVFGTFTVKVSTGNEFPPLTMSTASVQVTVMVVVPECEQLQFVPELEANV